MRYFAIGTMLLAALAVPYTAQEDESYGNDQIEVTVSKPFLIASAPPPFGFPTLYQLGPKSLMLAVWSNSDTSSTKKECDRC